LSQLKDIKKEIVERARAGELTPEQAVQEFEKRALPGRTYQPKDRDARKRQYYTDRDLRLRARSTSVPFISSAFNPIFKLSQGLVLVGGVSGQGKSTTAANIVAGFLDNSDRKAIVLTNEETSESVYNRVAAIQTRNSFFDLQRGKLPPTAVQEVEDQANLLMDRLIIEAGDSVYEMNCIEDVEGALEYAAGVKDVGLILLDYYQTVNTSRECPDDSPYQVLKRLGFYLKDYGRRAAVPVVCFAQLKNRSESPDFKERVEGDRTIYNHAFTVVEIVPDFKTCITKFTVHKDRFGYGQGKEIEMEYVNGWYQPVGGGSL
jgi:replicative DNA helicase